jgi:hypothetical protein
MSYLSAKTQYLIAIHLPDNFDPSTVDPATEHDIDVLNDEMVAKGVRTFVGGLLPVANAKSLRAQPGPGGKVVVTDGPYLETKEHIGGFWTKPSTGDAKPSSPAAPTSKSASSACLPPKARSAA